MGVLLRESMNPKPVILIHDFGIIRDCFFQDTKDSVGETQEEMFVIRQIKYLEDDFTIRSTKELRLTIAQTKLMFAMLQDKFKEEK